MYGSDFVVAIGDSANNRAKMCHDARNDSFADDIVDKVRLSETDDLDANSKLEVNFEEKDSPMLAREPQAKRIVNSCPVESLSERLLSMKVSSSAKKTDIHIAPVATGTAIVLGKIRSTATKNSTIASPVRRTFRRTLHEQVCFACLMLSR